MPEPEAEEPEAEEPLAPDAEEALTPDTTEAEEEEVLTLAGAEDVSVSSVGVPCVHRRNVWPAHPTSMTAPHLLPHSASAVVWSVKSPPNRFCSAQRLLLCKIQSSRGLATSTADDAFVALVLTFGGTAPLQISVQKTDKLPFGLKWLRFRQRCVSGGPSSELGPWRLANPFS